LPSCTTTFYTGGEERIRRGSYVRVSRVQKTLEKAYTNTIKTVDQERREKKLYTLIILRGLVKKEVKIRISGKMGSNRE